MMAKDNYPTCPVCGDAGNCNECCQIIFEEENEDPMDEQRGVDFL